MSERDTYQAGVPCWVDSAQPDPEAAVAFYSGLFGWEFGEPGAMPDGGRYYVAQLRGRDVAAVSSQPAQGAPPSPMWITYVSVDSADAATQAASDAGGKVILEPFDAEPAGRMAVLADPAGAGFCVWQPGIRQGAQLLNEPGAWAWSQLHSPDPESAKAFYPAVFGWQAESMDDGFTLWRVPGYVGGEPQQPVPRDSVAGMVPGEHAHWSVDFWVDDVDATAERARELGGSVAAGPYDTPIARQAMIADPAGAGFSVSKVNVGG